MWKLSKEIFRLFFIMLYLNITFFKLDGLSYDDITIIRPINNEVINNSSPVFEWSYNGVGYLNFSIYHNSNRIYYQELTDNGYCFFDKKNFSLTIDLSKDLMDGNEYYWCIDVLFCGSFTDYDSFCNTFFYNQQSSNLNSKKLISCDLNSDKKDDIISQDTNGNIYYSTNKSNWTKMNGTITKDIACGDLNGDGYADIVGVNTDGSIWRTLDKGSNWSQIPGVLSRVFVSDINGDNKADVIGLNAQNQILVTYNLNNWNPVSGTLSDIQPGNFNTSRQGNELAGINSNNNIYYTSDLSNWTPVSGALSKMFVGEINGDGRSDLLGINSNKEIYYSTDLALWTKISGLLEYITTGDLNGDGINDIVGYNTNGAIYYTTSFTNPNWINITGALTTLITGDFDGNGKDDIAGIGTDGKIYITTDLKTWNSIN